MFWDKKKIKVGNIPANGLPLSGTVEIPNLKKEKEEEKKKSGLSLGQTGSPISGLSSAAASAAAQSSATVALGASAARGAAGILSRGLLATMLGKTAAIAAAAALISGGGVMMYSGYTRMNGGAGAGADASGPELGGITTTVKIKSADARGLQYAGNSSKGELQFLQPQKAASAAKSDAVAPNDQKTDVSEDNLSGGTGVENVGDPAAGETGLNAADNGNRLASLSGAKLSTNLNDKFSGNAPKFGAGFDRGRIVKFDSATRSKGMAARLSRAPVKPMKSSKIRGRGFCDAAHPCTALNQLNFGSGLNNQTQTGLNEKRSEVAQTQFSGTQSEGGAPPTTPVLDHNPTVNPIGGGGSAPIAPIEEGENVTSDQMMIDRAKNLAEQAAKDKKQGTILLVLGGLLLAAGIVMLVFAIKALYLATVGFIVWPAFWAAMKMLLKALGMIMGGLLMILMGMKQIDQSKKQAQQGEQIANQLERDKNRRAEAERIRNCMKQAANGVSPENCQQKPASELTQPLSP